ncbi:MAG: hypothetical protein ACE5E6_01990, partial [Phycisphaerae bacterium]
MPALVVIITASAPSRAADDADILADAIARFEDHDYLTAQELLVGIDPTRLNENQRALREDYLTRVQVAMNMSDQAVRAVEDAQTAADEGETERALHLLDKVRANPYAGAAERAAAEQLRRTITGAEASDTVDIHVVDEPPAKPATREAAGRGQAEPDEARPGRAPGHAPGAGRVGAGETAPRPAGPGERAAQ